jgi:hypothetical protein
MLKMKSVSADSTLGGGTNVGIDFSLQGIKKIAFVFVTSIAMLACTHTEKPELQVIYNPATYQPMPDNYGYMQDTAALVRAVDSANTVYVRKHAWGLFQALLEPAKKSTWPLWFTWPTTADIFIQSPPQSDDKLMSVESNTLEVLSLVEKNKKLTAGLHASANDTVIDQLPLPYYPLPQAVIDRFPSVINKANNSISMGSHFINNGDVMIPTESFSIEAYSWILDTKTNKKSTLQELYNDPVKRKAGLDVPSRYVVTKHMYWPVLQNQPCFVPVWNPAQFPNPESSMEYAGYETWNEMALINLSKDEVIIDSLPFLVGVYSDTSLKTSLTKYIHTSGVPVMRNLDHFYNHQVTAEEWDTVFTEADRAIITAASYWAYGKPFQPGDYLVMVAMHINTKEIASWALQSIWWTNNPTGEYAAQRPKTNTALDHYNMVDAYGIPDHTGNLPIGMNPYIELVIHPIATNCNNCHIRAGFPEGPGSDTDKASYQNASCRYMLQKMDPETTNCLKQYLRTDFQWVIPDNAK